MTESPFRKSRSDSGSIDELRKSKRQRILDAAAKVFAEQGFHGTRITDIARMAQVADGTIYLYFDNKQALLISLFDETIQAFFDMLGRELNSLDSATDKLRRLISTQLSMLDREPALARLLTINFRQPHGALLEHVTPTYDAYLERLAEIIREGQDSGEFRSDLSPRRTAQLIYGAIDGLILAWVVQRPPRPPLSDSQADVARLLLEGIQSP